LAKVTVAIPAVMAQEKDKEGAKKDVKISKGKEKRCGAAFQDS